MLERAFLVRHGQSEGNVIEDDCRENSANERTIQDIDWDADDWNLTEVGRAQSVQTGAYLRAVGLDSGNCEIWTSPLSRARETASHLGLIAVSKVVDSLYERRTVNVSYMDIREAVRSASSEKEARRIAMRDTFNERVEPLETMLERISPVVDRLKEEDKPNIVIVSHGYIMLGMRALLEELDEEQITGIFRGGSVVNSRQTRNGDIHIYNKSNPEGRFTSRQHIGPSDGYVSNVVALPRHR
ncbi:MAG: histidine phosphatase family protein [Candidatus Saccharimonas sp.]